MARRNDPMVGRPIGGVNVFGGGLALYLHGKRIGGLGVSGDQSCTDHFVAWRVRHILAVGGVTLDNLYDVGGRERRQRASGQYYL